MAWTTTDWTPGEIQADADEFWKALNERRQAIGSAVVNEPAVGANIQSGSSAAPPTTTGKFGWRYLQDQIASLCHSFVRSHNNDGSARATNYYDEQDAIEMWSFATLMKAVRGGTAQSDFRRATSYPAAWTSWADAAYSDGRVAQGDIFGPWIPTDIQKALNMLIWTKHDWRITNPPNYRSVLFESPAGDSRAGYVAFADAQTVWVNAKGIAESEFDAATGAAHSSAPRARTYGRYQVSTGYYLAAMSRTRRYIRIHQVPTHCSRSIDWYIFAGLPDSGFVNVFDANGDNVHENKWSLWLTDATSPATDTFLSSQKFPPSLYPKPTWCGIPVDYAGEMQGWVAVNDLGGSEYPAYAMAVVRWNVTGGFSYA